MHVELNNALIGMVHVGALPGTPGGDTPVDMLAGQAAVEARMLADAGFDAVILENMHDAPYVHGEDLGPEIVAAMTRVGLEIESVVGGLPLGVQILSGGNRHALAVAQSIGASFIRAENFVYAHVADEGLLAKAEAGELLRYRKRIDAADVAVYTDIKKKHASHAITADLSIEDAAEAALFFGSDGLIVTGTSTGKPTAIDDVRRVKAVAGVRPVLVGSGVTPDSAPALLDHADALIVGSAIKHDGHWSNPVDPQRAAALVKAARAG
jgi:membrane complex biogenesis BtpA family protein